MASPNILQLLISKARGSSKMSPDAQLLLHDIKSQFDNPVFQHFFNEFEVLKEIGLTDTDLKNYFNEWCTEAVSIVNDQAEMLFANEKFSKLFGYSYEDILGMNGYNLYDREGQEIIRNKVELRKRGLTDTYETTILKKNKERINVRITGHPLLNVKGEYVGSLAVIRDINKEKELENQLRLINEELEAKVQKRTRELTISNYQMMNEIKERKLAEIALKHSEVRFRDLFYSSPEGVFVEDFAGNILDLNEGGARLHGYTRDEMLGKNVRDFSPSEDAQSFDFRQQKLKMGEIRSFEAQVKHRDGHIIPIAVYTAVIDFNGKPALLLHARDITDRVRYQETLKQVNQNLEEKVKQRTIDLQSLNQTLQIEVNYRKEVETAIEQQKDFLRLLIDMNPNLIFVKDRESRFVLVNEAFAKFHNTVPQAMIGKHQSEYSSGAELDFYLEQDRQVLVEKQTLSFDELKLYHKGNKSDIYAQMVKRPIKSLVDDSYNLLGIISDTTSIKRADERLKQSEQLYRQIARNVPNSAIFIFDKNLRYVLAEGPLIGIISPPKEMIEGKTVKETILDVSKANYTVNNYQEILNGTAHLEVYEEDGRSLLTNLIPIRDNDDKVIYGMVIIQDITDLKIAEKELEDKAFNLKRSNEELERFAYVASHDLQGPLRTITSYLQLLEQRYFATLGDDAKDFIAFSVSGAKRMQQLITDLLNYSRLNSVPRPYQAVNLSELVFIVTKSLESTIAAKGATIEYDNLPVIFAEQYQLTQVLQNLIDNGMKFIKDKPPQITVTCTEDDNYWTIAIRDNGIGIKDEFKDKIFLIFQRLHTDSEYPGTGIGLAICKKVADLHGGNIWFESTYGQGTTFFFSISKHLKNK